MILIMVFMVMLGLILTAMGGFLPNIMFQMLFFTIGIILSCIGMFILIIRAYKTGAIHLLGNSTPDKMIWFFIRRDGNVDIMPAIKKTDGMAKSKDGTKVIHDLKSYRLFDWNVRFVAEDIGHSTDIDMVLYTKLLKNKYGFESIKDARYKIFKSLNKNKSKEHIEVGDLNE